MLVAPADMTAVLGWDLKPEGLCRGDVCVPVRGDSGVRHDGRVDLVATSALLGSSTLVDDEAGIAAVSVPADRRRDALKGRVAPDFVLPDLDGNLHSLEKYKDRKRLLIAFASW